MPPVNQSTTGTIQIADDSIYPSRKVPTAASEELSGSSDVEQGKETIVNIDDIDFNTKKKQVRLLCHVFGYLTGGADHNLQ
jgi:hypothetical protein